MYSHGLMQHEEALESCSAYFEGKCDPALSVLANFEKIQALETRRVRNTAEHINNTHSVHRDMG